VHVVLAGGGTAGHIEPALNLADALRRRDPDVGITALGTDRGLEGRLVPARGYELRMIPAVPLPRRPSGDLVTLPRRVREALGQTEAILADVHADVVVGFGGYVALPAYLAARRTRTPLVIHEANARPGLANRVGARFTTHVAEAVAGTLPGGRRIGIPLRSTISTLDRGAARGEARAALGLAPQGLVLLVFGGSQGAQRINAAVSAALPGLLDLGVQVLHSVGQANIDAVTDSGPGYHPVAYLNRMDLAYAAADLVVSRSGAMTCAELAAVGLPAIYVPFPIGNGEQRLNALPVVNAGGGLLVADEDLDGGTLLADVRALVADPERIERMGARAAAHGIRDADEKLADMVIDAAGRPAGRRAR
jgi:UDP-N-acetylglucosamine--N-acetylmuramyl-(pentapeptide) pyrophosphoryl-undecaprenol N-acetylglucosamine transferase